MLIKEILSIGKNYNYSILTSTVNHNSKINIIYSYCTKKNFNKDGSFNDTYFGKSVKNKNIYWFLISLDNFIPKKSKNIFVIYKEKILSIFFIFSNLFVKIF